MNFRWASVRLSSTVWLRTWGANERFRVDPQTSTDPEASTAGRRVVTASTTAPAIWSTRNCVHAGSKPERLEANRL